MIDNLKVVTWNISGEDLPAKIPWNLDLETKWELIAQELKQWQPHILALQEIPILELAITYAEQLELLAVQSIETHAGHTVLAIPKSWKNKIQHIVKTSAGIGCIVKQDEELWGIIALHMAPTKQMADIRKQQLYNLMKILASRCDRIILAGDTNMRKREQAILLELQLEDAFHLANTPKNHRWTWNGYKNPYHADAFAFTARFDKILLSKWNVEHFQLIGASALEPDVYLSDHFGIFVELSLA